jgi:hypothetical protein
MKLALTDAAETLEHVRAHYRIAQEQDEALDLIWAFRRLDGTEVVQLARVQAIAGWDEATWIRVTAPIGRRQIVDPAAALEHNVALAFGSVAFVGDSAVVTAKLRPPLSPEDLRLALELIPRDAAQLREGRLAPGAAKMFHEYAE